MRLKVLGCSGGFDYQHRPTGFLLDGDLLLDGGTINSALRDGEMKDIRYCLVSHAHLDHIRELAFLLHTKSVIAGSPLTVVGHEKVISAVRAHIFNNTVWPDFTTIGEPPYLNYQAIDAGEWISIGDYEVRAELSNHRPTTTGFMIKKGGVGLAYSSDIGFGASDGKCAFTDFLTQNLDIENLIVEATFPDRLEDFANMTLHNTAAHVADFVKGLGRNMRVLITHMRPVDIAEIQSDFEKSGIDVEYLRQDQVYEITAQAGAAVPHTSTWP